MVVPICRAAQNRKTQNRKPKNTKFLGYPNPRPKSFGKALPIWPIRFSPFSSSFFRAFTIGQFYYNNQQRSMFLFFVKRDFTLHDSGTAAIRHNIVPASIKNQMLRKSNAIPGDDLCFEHIFVFPMVPICFTVSCLCDDERAYNNTNENRCCLVSKVEGAVNSTETFTNFMLKACSLKLAN